ncbi:DHA2 family efflux MFS transporter permease subunit [Methyloceanibacter sp.]|uniref:DHA2 family efflux MFS transporter permease subunit n=1 Tax=Methyloceanibacter sp. TaxID=1965321 RepID=UPI002C2B7309|nr:DHA2 family efflux MFS transporter permease subunit [Methyloceanibacter sp.]HML91841.1 DHA2 family efflux MFS transporter permease subunit [Methyloceanibacter sp.]
MPRYYVTLIVAVALFMETMDSTIIATSLPAIAADLGEDPIALKLALTSYLLSLAVFIPISGWMADRFGARTVFRAAIVVFTLGSAACGFSTSLLDFILFRVVQGMGGAMMVPVGRLVILRSIPKSELISSLAWLTVPALMGPVIGPPLGGFITTMFSWRWIFWINIPVGLLGIYLATRFIENFKEEKVPALDLKGFFLSGIGLAGLAFGFTIVGQPLFPSWFVAGLLTVGAISCVLYVRHALKIPAPLLDLRLLKIPTFFANIAGGFLFRIGVGATPFLLPLYFQLGFGMTPLESGMLTFSIAVGAIVMKTTAAPILRQFGYRPILVWNAIIAGSFIMVCALFTEATPQVVILATLLVGGFFRSLEFTAINTIAYADIDGHEMSKATSFASVSQQISISAGVAVGALVLEMQRAGREGHEVLASDFHAAFLIVGAIAASSALVFMRLPKDAGASLSRRAHAVGEPAKQSQLRTEDRV